MTEQKKPEKIFSTERYLLCLSVCGKGMARLYLISGQNRRSQQEYSAQKCTYVFPTIHESVICGDIFGKIVNVFQNCNVHFILSSSTYFCDEHLKVITLKHKSRARCYMAFYSCNLLTFVMSYSVCP